MAARDTDTDDGIVHVAEPAATSPVPPQTVEEFRAEQLDEWGVYVAAVPIDIGGVRAFNRGEAVPKSHVDRGVVPADFVAKAGTKAAEKIAQQ